ncbi:hypothetical protein AVEN_261574-1 [Araneus ventricosus]|uniref:Uncharacterized protein n=1 Tax=Araneus ventricosus TaxID=182803 RepID=A0A4Y2E9M1_ARAVE|nr:hypothetical protein AVEN_261574-1 [Araneus ventricosus]
MSCSSFCCKLFLRRFSSQPFFVKTRSKGCLGYPLQDAVFEFSLSRRALWDESTRESWESAIWLSLYFRIHAEQIRPEGTQRSGGEGEPVTISDYPFYTHRYLT